MKFKVFMPCGTIQTIIADKFTISGSVLRFYKNDILLAYFPEGGWHGVQDMSLYDIRKVEV